VAADTVVGRVGDGDRGDAGGLSGLPRDRGGGARGGAEEDQQRQDEDGVPGGVEPDMCGGRCHDRTVRPGPNGPLIRSQPLANDPRNAGRHSADRRPMQAAAGGDRCYKNAVQFRILGPLAVSGDDGPLPLGGQKQRAVLALLLRNAGRVVSTDSLTNALWGEAPPRTAGTSLQNFVVGLRRALGADVLVTRPPGYMLAVEPEQVDLACFERLR